MSRRRWACFAATSLASSNDQHQGQTMPLAIEILRFGERLLQLESDSNFVDGLNGQLGCLSGCLLGFEVVATVRHRESAITLVLERAWKTRSSRLRMKVGVQQNAAS